MTLRANCRLSVPATFIPIGCTLRPLTCAESIAASPSTTTLPWPSVNASPWARPAAGPVRPGMAGRGWSTADGESLRSATEPAGPLSDCPANVRTRSIRSEPSRPVRIGWSPSSPFTREKFNCAGTPVSELAGSNVVLLPISTPSRVASRSFDVPQG